MPATKIKRRTKTDMEQLHKLMVDFCRNQHPLSVRNLYYAMAQAQHVPKDHNGYKFVMRESGKLRESGRIPFNWLTDESRRVIEIYTCANVADGLDDLQRDYRRCIWNDQPVYSELWVEAKASITTLSPLVREYAGLRLVPVGGFSGKSFLWECAQHLGQIRKPIHIIYAGDHDPSGEDIERDILERLRRYAPLGLGCRRYMKGAGEFHLHRVAITERQIVEMGLLTREPNKNDPRAHKFSGDSVAELEAIAPNDLREMCRTALHELLNMEALEQTRDAEQEDLEQLRQWIAEREDLD